jgi:antitoxin component YwqK of YwqJK toxin-antitoxin module
MCKKKILLIIILLGGFIFIFNSCKVYTPDRYPLISSCLLIQGDSSVRFSYFTSKKLKIEPKLSREYYYFNNKRLLYSSGSVNGRLLQGEYKVTDSIGHILTSGLFKTGLKSGTWLNFYSDGKPRTCLHYRNGKPEGTFTSYDQNGKLLKTGNYKNGLLHGKVFEFAEDGVTCKKYKNGILIPTKVRSKQRNLKDNPVKDIR